MDQQLVTTAPTWGPPKTKKSDRTITVGKQTGRMLLEHMRQWAPHESGLIFTGRENGPLARTSMATAWNSAVRRAGLSLRDRSGWHELRHHHASLLIAAGLSAVAVADRLGHQDSTETLKTYAHLWGDDESRAVAAIESSLWSVASGVDELSQHPQSTRSLEAAG